MFSFKIILLFSVLVGVSAVSYSEEKLTDNEIYLSAIAMFKTKAASISSSEIHQEIQKSQDALRFKQKSKYFEFPNLLDEDVQKGTAFLMVLEERRKNNEAEAAFYFGLHEIKNCMVLRQNKDVASFANQVCGNAIKSLKIAADANDPRAMEAIALMYSDGIGVNSSKFVAADWFVKAAKQYKTERQRENALSSVEEALKLVPDYQSAIKIKKELLD